MTLASVFLMATQSKTQFDQLKQAVFTARKTIVKYQKFKVMRNLKLLLLTFVLLVLTTGCTDNTEDLVTNTTQNTELIDQDVQALGETGGDDDGDGGGDKD